MDIPHIEWENSGLIADGYSSVIVPDTESPLTDEQMAALREVVDPRAASQSFGCDIYVAAVQLWACSIWNLKDTHMPPLFLLFETLFSIVCQIRAS